jgi:hypothetical protein
VHLVPLLPCERCSDPKEDPGDHPYNSLGDLQRDQTNYKVNKVRDKASSCSDNFTDVAKIYSHAYVHLLRNDMHSNYIKNISIVIILITLAIILILKNNKV